VAGARDLGFFVDSSSFSSGTGMGLEASEEKGAGFKNKLMLKIHQGRLAF
jgi:hypothetical protein